MWDGTCRCIIDNHRPTCNFTFDALSRASGLTAMTHVPENGTVKFVNCGVNMDNTTVTSTTCFQVLTCPGACCQCKPVGCPAAARSEIAAARKCTADILAKVAPDMRSWRCAPRLQVCCVLPLAHDGLCQCTLIGLSAKGMSSPKDDVEPGHCWRREALVPCRMTPQQWSPSRQVLMRTASPRSPLS